MQIDPRHLEQLAVIVETGTLQQAADRIGTSQPALSRMISTLEARIGMELFERTTRPLKPTSIGVELAHQGRAIRTARLRAVEMVDFGTRGFFGVLRIGAPPFLCRSLMSEAIASFLEARPKIRVELISDYHAGLMERIFLNQIDVIVGPTKFADKSNTDLTLEPLFRDPNVIVGREGHPLLEKPLLTAADLESVTWVGHSERSILLSDMSDALKEMGVSNPRVAFQSESAEAVLELLRNTNFLTVLPVYALRPGGSDGLAAAQADLPAHSQMVNAITLAQRPETKLTADFKAHLKDSIAARKT